MNSAADNTVRTSSISEISSLIPTASIDNQHKDSEKKKRKKRNPNKKAETESKAKAKSKNANTGHVDYLAS